eukprot:8109546-Pyramimonas_sp.AAC.1
MKMNLNNTTTSNRQANKRTEDKNKQMVALGFNEPWEAENLISKVQGLLKKIDDDMNNINVTTFRNPTEMATVTFPT